MLFTESKNNKKMLIAKSISRNSLNSCVLKSLYQRRHVNFIIIKIRFLRENDKIRMSRVRENGF
jgi:hypothetical protein